jgi:hypothetical protein
MTTQGSLQEQTRNNNVAYFGGANRSVSSGSKNNYTLQELEKIVTNSVKKA